MQVEDKGFFLGSKQYGEKSNIVFIFSQNNGLIKSLTRFTKKDSHSFMTLDRISFVWKAKHQDNLGFVKLSLDSGSNLNNNEFLVNLIKSSASELCLNFLPPWQKNIEIFNELIKLLGFLNQRIGLIINSYILWELNFLKHTGYGINLNECSVSGSKENIYYISPKSGNSVTYTIGKKYDKKLFKIPNCFKSFAISNDYYDYCNGLEITTYFLRKSFEFDTNKLIIRNQLIEKIRSL